MISSDKVKELRERSGISVMECKHVLEEAGGDIERALKMLESKFGGMASKKTSRATRDGIIEAYIHSNGKLGVLLELHSETDFVARNPAFRELAHDIVLHIAAMNPRYRSVEDIPEKIVVEERAVIEHEVARLKKPKEVTAQIIEGKLEARLSELSLLSQPFVKDPTKTVKGLIDEAVGKFGENIRVGRFARLEI
ncbi:MAG: elongation factor Ts [Candidatus Sungbacteria bacterium]|uniref:Elongation factor Ts n=1 Tax=Candidatus Sungiibacteriota bacterium TaxID=2750080 RepID=A0A931SDI7_9BACT|nr:elongation factor Ts [Candidatus Sungbacteria bacterium]